MATGPAHHSFTTVADLSSGVGETRDILKQMKDEMNADLRELCSPRCPWLVAVCRTMFLPMTHFNVRSMGA